MSLLFFFGVIHEERGRVALEAEVGAKSKNLEESSLHSNPMVSDRKIVGLKEGEAFLKWNGALRGSPRNDRHSVVIGTHTKT